VGHPHCSILSPIGGKRNGFFFWGGGGWGGEGRRTGRLSLYFLSSAEEGERGKGGADHFSRMAGKIVLSISPTLTQREKKKRVQRIVYYLN